MLTRTVHTGKEKKKELQNQVKKNTKCLSQVLKALAF